MQLFSSIEPLGNNQTYLETKVFKIDLLVFVYANASLLLLANKLETQKNAYN